MLNSAHHYGRKLLNIVFLQTYYYNLSQLSSNLSADMLLSPTIEESNSPPYGWSLPSNTPSVVGTPVSQHITEGHRSYVDPERLTRTKEPLKYGGSLDGYRSFNVTPKSGREFPDAKLSEWMQAPNSDQLLRDLAVTVSQRGVVFFRAQDDMTIELQKQLAQRLGLLSGKPAQNSLHIFPYTLPSKKGGDLEVTVITHEDKPENGKTRARLQDPDNTPIYEMWHSDTTFEHVPCDYAVLRMVQMPQCGGDTVWASGYEVYNRLSRPLQSLFESLTFTGGQPRYHQMAAAKNIPSYENPRGAPENVGTHVRAVHPVVRTNPITGWNSIYALGHHVEYINGVSRSESKKLLDWLHDMVVMNHDIHVRHRWVNENDMAIWDNRSMVHTATPDYLDQGLGNRKGFRVISIGERPYFDPQGVSISNGLI